MALSDRLIYAKIKPARAPPGFASDAIRLDGHPNRPNQHPARVLQGDGAANHNKAVCALANKLARICYGVLRDQTPFGQPDVRLPKKLSRKSFELAH